MSIFNCIFYKKNPIISGQDKLVLFLICDAVEIEQRRWQVKKDLEKSIPKIIYDQKKPYEDRVLDLIRKPEQEYKTTKTQITLAKPTLTNLLYKSALNPSKN